jgi:hypothetical protein
MTKARTLADNFAADINGITAGTGITGGGTSGTVTITNQMATTIDAKGDLVVGTGADAFGRLAVASTAGYVLTVDSAETTGLKWAALPAAIPTNSTSSVSTLEGTSSGGYTDLTTVGPAVTVTTGTKALVIISCELRPDTNAAPTVGCAVSGATTQSADDDRKLRKNWGNDEYISASYATLFTGLTAGSNTFTLKYKNEGSGTANFRYRRVTVIDMGS